MKRRRSFTLVEMLIVIGIIVVLAALLVPVLLQAKARGKEVTCINNIRNLGMGIQLYYNEHDAFPTDRYLDQALKDVYPAKPEAFECPSTHMPYDTFYVPRGGNDLDNYFVGCPYHHVVNFGPGLGTQKVDEMAVTWNGQSVHAGQEVGSGTLHLADGSTVTVTGKVMLLASYRRKHDSRLRTFIRIFEDYVPTSVHAEITPGVGSRFEVVTPAAIAGVQGTVFDVATAHAPDGTDQTTVSVTRGAVEVKGPYVDKPEKVQAGGRKTAKTHKKHQMNKKRKGKGGGGGNSWWPPWG